MGAKEGKYLDVGLLIIRVGIGAMFMYHGFPKLTGGSALWAKLGEAMSVFGVQFFPAFWGFMAAFAEFFGGIFLILGLLFRPACGFLLVTMFVASMMLLNEGHGLQEASHAVELAIVFLGLLFIGPGSIRFSSK